MNSSIDAVTRLLMEECGKAKGELKTLNVMVLGKTGVGKSTLINSLFGRKVAEIGIGKPVTRDIRKHEVEGEPLALWDVPGCELSGTNGVDSLCDQIIEEMKKGIASGDISRAIHCILYCVNTNSHRFEEAERDFIKKLSDGFVKLVSSVKGLPSYLKDLKVPVIIVLTQSCFKQWAQELKAAIEREHLGVKGIIPVLAERCAINDEYSAKAFGLDTLADCMHKCIPEGVRNTFVATQIVDMGMKEEKAKAIVFNSAAAAVVAGAVPIPFADAAVLVPIQICMLAKITSVFGLSRDETFFKMVLSMTVGSAGTTVLGRTTVSGLLKLMPGVGSVVGGVISAATAAGLTTALGEAYVSALMGICKGKINAPSVADSISGEQIKALFKERLKIKRDKKGRPL